MNKLIVTRWNQGILTALQSEGGIIQLNLDPGPETSILGNIYIGKVKNIVKNINSAFVEFASGQMGYYSLSENRCHIYAKPHSGGGLKAGDEIVVQVSRDAVKTKAPVLTGNLSFPGKYCVLTLGKHVVGFSSKIRDQEWKASVKQILPKEAGTEYGVIIRTNAQETEPDSILSELASLCETSRRMLSEAAYRTCFSQLYHSVPSYISDIRDLNSGTLQEIITDDEEIFYQLKEYMAVFQPGDSRKLTHYQDKMLPLGKLYSLESALDHALNKRVWLKSGGYLVIEPTEALVVIDVNTGKFSEKKEIQAAILKTNLEAASEISRQLRLRNLSGIIIVDFIDMEKEEDKKELLSCLEALTAKDPVKTTVVDMTRLNLVEITRKKVRRPLYEQVSFNRGEE
ncbi:ribonuclease E/G [Clostridium sp. MCC353]|uniref:ribonuclease E/G n=1 Tax=Clostridium sp. MCC353 TaxID=2592646 RepID=UPI001C02E6A4|nr:ribonuclease E/G [Clostridium sp. MCC353]MBT9776956.1 ribonuclease E/G [Clostridium sp. MCC353]